MRKVFTPQPLSRAIVFALGASGMPAIGLAQDEPETLKTIEVIGATPIMGVRLPQNKVPYNVQTADDDDLDRTTSLDMTDYMSRNFTGVIINDAQNNPLQPDIQFRGFTASPLLGLPQGLSVYQNGARINEVFGDTINWDLVPESSIANLNLISGANPLYGLNTLGGAVSIETKNGFTHPGHSLEFYGGSHDRFVTTIETGGNNGKLGYYTTVQRFDEEGWRDASPSDSINVFSSLGYRDGDQTTLDLNFNFGDTDLVGNGAIPIELAEQDREAIFTSPDQTNNQMFLVQLNGEHWINDLTQVSGNIFYRDNDTNAFNGDGTEFEDCDEAGGPSGFLCEEEDNEAILDQNGNMISAEGNNGLQNRSEREQKNFGINLQTTFLGDLFNRENQLIVGTGYNYGDVDFFSNQEIGRLTAQRSTVGTGFFVPEEGTAITSETESWSLFLSDTLSVTNKLDFTLSGRYNHTSVELDDRGGTIPLTTAEPDLNGDHSFDRFNPAAGLTYAFKPNLSGYFNYSESMRAPTAVELACAREDAPCNLPNGFLADPPLDEVVAKSFEGGFRGSIANIAILDRMNWELGFFHTTNEDDIVFQTTGGVSSNEGFFDNIGDTERVGIELGLNGQLQRLNWFLNYSYTEATFEDAFTAASANNPAADANGKIQVQPGDDIPGIPNHSLKLGGDYRVTSKLSIGGDLTARSGVYLRGDESNQLDKLDAFTTVNIRGTYQFTDRIDLFARVNNLFDTDTETFGLLGEPDEVPGFENFEDNRFVGVGQPIGAWIGVRVEL